MSNAPAQTSPSGKYLPVGTCQHCSKTYYSRLALAKHLRLKH